MFKLFQCHQCIFPILLLFPRVWPFIRTDLKPLHLKMLFITIGCFWRIKSLNVNVVSQFSFHFPLKKAKTLYCYKLQSYSAMSLDKIVWIVLEKYICFNVGNVFWIFRYYLPLYKKIKGVALHLSEDDISLLKDDLWSFQVRQGLFVF